jgi:sec-independent protein translocase protein TatB
MFGIGWTELLVIAIVAIVVVGPKDLPRLLCSFGHYAVKLGRMANDFKQQVDEAMREAELVEVREAIDILREQGRTVDLRASTDGNLMLPKQHAVGKPYVNSEARAPVVLERASPRPRHTRRKASGASSLKKPTAPKC